MSDDKPTFLDPKTRREVEGTWLSRLTTAGVYSLASWALWNSLWCPRAAWAFCALTFTIVIAWPTHPKCRWLHDAIARWQHQRRGG
jgi:hypothetical protein